MAEYRVVANGPHAFRKGDIIVSTTGRTLEVTEDASADQFKIWVRAPGESDWEIWRSEIDMDATEQLTK